MTQPFQSPVGPAGFWQEMVGPSGAVRSINGASASIQSANSTFIFQPGGVASGNTYNDWATLYAATLLVSGPKTIYFDDSLAAISIPAGAYDFGRECTFAGLVPPFQAGTVNRAVVTCPNGVTFTTPIYNIADIQLLYSGTGTLMTIPLDGRYWKTYLSGFGRLTASGAAGEIFRVGAAALFVLLPVDFASCTVSGGGFIWNVLAGAVEADIQANNVSQLNTIIPSNSLKGVAGPLYVFTATRLSQISLTQASMPGGVIAITSFVFGAPNLPYTPTTATHWSPAPTSVQGALDAAVTSQVTVLADANVAIAYGTNAVDGGINSFEQNPTGARTITIAKPTKAGTEVRIANVGAVDITLAYSGGGAPTTAALQSYVRPFGSLWLVYNGTTWDVLSAQIQAGGSTLVNGVSALVPADILGGDVVTTGLLLWNGASGILQVFGIVAGTKAGGGGFQLKSVAQATGLPVLTDQGTYNWHVQH